MGIPSVGVKYTGYEKVCVFDLLSPFTLEMVGDRLMISVEH